MKGRLLATVLVTLALSGCAGLVPPTEDLPGTWHHSGTAGDASIEFFSDGRFSAPDTPRRLLPGGSPWSPDQVDWTDRVDQYGTWAEKDGRIQLRFESPTGGTNYLYWAYRDGRADVCVLFDPDEPWTKACYEKVPDDNG